MTELKTSGRSPKAHGGYPKFVYRAFRERFFADEFALHGRFRLANLRVYIAIEDAGRRDPSEGKGHFQSLGTVTTVGFVPGSDESFVRQAPGYVHTHTELLNPTFILSCALPGVDLGHLRSRFGVWVAKIDNPRGLAHELARHLGQLAHRFAGVEGCVVHYNKGGRVRPSLSNIARTRLSYSQKPITFGPDKEFRFVTHAMGSPRSRFNDNYLSVDLGRSLDYVNVI
jgi:hypothetical protein